ncbi:methyl-accepting chemotaxis protein [Candidatus Magnetomorum sp. HK-1]|nr:methyl-accepting chemotaxis protein [Candidatus Magnetomorum sp. HK-1]
MISIKTKLTITALGAFFIVLIMFIETWWITGMQKNDGLVINLAGRQRMLTQKMTKETLFYNSMLKSGNTNDLTKLRDQVHGTMKIFDITLSALKNSGDAPTTLNLSTSPFRFCPKASEPAYSQLEKVSQIWQKFSSQIEKNLSSKKFDQVSLDWVMQQNMRLLKEMNKAVGMMQKQSESKITLLLWLQLGGIITAVVFAVFSMFTIKIILNKLNCITRFARKLGSGDLTAQSTIQGNDELGIIGNELDQMAEKLKDMFSEISQTAIHLESSSTEFSHIARELSEKLGQISNNSSQVSKAANETSKNMLSVAAAMEEISSNTSNMASSADHITTSINDVSLHVDKAKSITLKAVNESKSTSEQVLDLKKAASEIGSVTDDIIDISEQTNLLALNATIEAARAGDAGKGFAVVANEVKLLASQTGEATDHIRNRVKKIQDVTNNTAKQIQQVSSVVEDINSIVSLISDATKQEASSVKDITSNVVQSSQAVSEVNEKINMSSYAIKSTASDISDINIAANDLFAKSSDVKQHASELKGQADHLNKMLSNFKV